MRSLVKIMGVSLLLAGLFGPAAAWAEQPGRPVQVEIVVIEATKAPGQAIDPALKSRGLDGQLTALGYSGATVADQLNAKVGVRARVSLSMFEGSPQARKLTVFVRAVEPDGTIRLQITLDNPVVKLKTDHKNGGTALVAQPRSQQRALFLAVTPRLIPAGAPAKKR